MNIKGTQEVTVKFQADTEARAIEFCDYLDAETGLVFDYEPTKDGYVAFALEAVSGWYEPEVRYTRNGDGSPAYYEFDECMTEDYLYDIARAFEDRFDDGSIFTIDSWSCELIDY